MRNNMPLTGTHIWMLDFFARMLQAYNFQPIENCIESMDKDVFKQFCLLPDTQNIINGFLNGKKKIYRIMPKILRNFPRVFGMVYYIMPHDLMEVPDFALKTSRDMAPALRSFFEVMQVYRTSQKMMKQIRQNAVGAEQERINSAIQESYTWSIRVITLDCMRLCTA